MLPVSDAVKQLFTDGNSHNYSLRIEVGGTLYFSEPSLVITDQYIKLESVSLSESLFAGEDLKFGVINTAKFSCSLFNVNSNLKEKYIKVTLYYDNQAIPYGRFYVESFDRKAYSNERELVAYDYTYFLQKIIGGFAYSMTASDSAEVCYAIFDELGLQYDEFDFDNVYSYSRILPNASTLTFANFLEWVGELNWGWWRVDRYGVMEFLRIDTSSTPEEIDTVHPKSCSHEDAETIAFNGIKFSGYFNINQQLKQQDYEYGQTSNQYNLSPSNPFLATFNEEQLDELGAVLLQHYAITYIPNNVSFDGRPYMECGDMYEFENDDDEDNVITITAPVIQQTIKGIGALISTLSTKGTRYTSSQVQSQSSSISSTTNTVASSEQAIESLTEGVANYYELRNRNVVTIGKNQTRRIVRLKASSVIKTRMQIHININLYCSSDIDEEGVLPTTTAIVTYHLDNEEEDLHPTEVYIDGNHVMHLMYILEMEENTIIYFSVSMTAGDGDIIIPRNGFLLYAGGNGVVGDGVWNGEIELEEEAVGWTVEEPTFTAATEAVTVTTTPVLQITCSDVASYFVIQEPTFESASDSIRIVLESHVFDRVTEEGEYERVTEEGYSRVTEDEDGGEEE